MRFLAFILAVFAVQPVLSAPYELPISSLTIPVGFKCKMVDGKLVCGDFGKGETKADDDDDKPKKSKDKVIPKTCGKKVNCEAGFVKLEKPNKYGACCEAREGLPPEKCKFPGEVGTPPNCKCPPGTEFMGYRGCLPEKADPVAVPVGPSPKKVVEKNCCTGTYPDGSSAGRACGGDEAALRKIIASSRKLDNPNVAPNSITCAPDK